MIDLRQNKGFALAFSLIFIFLIVSFMAVYTLVVVNGITEAAKIANTKKAYYVADAGLADAYERITQAGINTIASSVCANANIPTGCTTPYIPAASTDTGKYTIATANDSSYTVSVVYSNNPRTNYIITSTGTYGNVSKTLQLQMIGASVSKWAYWSGTEINPALGGALWWVGMPGMVMLTDGPVQTNGQLNIFGNPIFVNAVTEANRPMLPGPPPTLGPTPTSSTPNYYYGTANNPNGNGSDVNYIFEQGIQNQQSPVILPPQQTLTAIQATASSAVNGTQQGLVLTGASLVTFNSPSTSSLPNGTTCPAGAFNSTGTVTVTGVVKNSAGTVTATYSNCRTNPPANGVIYVQSNTNKTDGNVTVQGTVSGALTVAADQNVYLSGSVQYNDQPVRAGISGGDPNSKDMLGLVANQNITVIAATAPAKLEIDAVLEALQGSFQVDQYTLYKGNASTAVMTQFGSLINFACGATGEMDMSGTLLGGWNQIQSYDTRLATIAPPGFPPFLNNSGNAVYSKYLYPNKGLLECNAGVCG